MRATATRKPPPLAPSHPPAHRVAGAILAVLAALATPAGAQSFVAFESGHVRPVAMSPDGSRVFAVNTPDNRLEIFDVQGGTLAHVESIPVGLEPVAVAARSNDEVWVVNHLSDSVSVVDVSATPPRVLRTLLVGDEPRDVVFAHGAAGQRAYVTTARRGQNSPVTPELATPGVGRALVWAFDPNDLGTTLAGTPLAIIELFGDTPRALAVSADGETVYAAVFHSGNRTTTIPEGAVCDGGAGAAPCDVFGSTMPGGLPAPNTSFDGTPQPEVGLIVRFDDVSGEWRDELDRSWNGAVRFDLPDWDVFAISNTTLTPVRNVAGVGTINFNMEVNPVSGRLYVSNTEARNEVRFEGAGTYVDAEGFKPAGEPASVNGHLHEARITIVDGLGNATPRHLNKHIDYDAVPSPPGTRDESLATPLGIAISSDGQTLYVAAFGSRKIGIFDTTELENDTFAPSSADHILLGGGGPTGIVLDEANDRLYVTTRFDNSISVIDTVTRTEIDHVPMYNPEPPHIVEGRPVLYDAYETSSNGEASCASCHVFGDVDGLAWDLGDPDGVQTTNDLVLADPLVGAGRTDFHPLKGPMTTQTLRGLASHGAQHWRGDRSVGHFGSDPSDAALSFKNFIVAFEGLLGRDGLIPEAEMTKFTDFMLDVVPPPNPIRPLDNRPSPAAVAGSIAFRQSNTVEGVLRCSACHVINPGAGLFGTNGERSSVDEVQQFKVPQLRSLYAKVGMFGMAEVPLSSGGDATHQGSQIRGFGMLHDGSVDTIFRFLGAPIFTLSTKEREDLEQFLFEVDANYAPIVGQQVTLTGENEAAVDSRLDLLVARAKTCFALLGVPDATECDLVARGTLAGEARSWLGVLQGDCGVGQTLLFQGDRARDPLLTFTQLRTLVAESTPHTYTCVPPGSGRRIALDRDEDGSFDRDELDAGSDPADAADVPTAETPAIVLAETTKMRIADNPADLEAKRGIVVVSKDPSIVVPPPGGPGDPTCSGDPPGTVKASVTVSSASSGQVHRADLPCQNWALRGTPTSPKGYRYKDRELDDGTVKSALWLEGRLKLVLRGKGVFFLSYDLQPDVSQGTVDVVLANADASLCLACPPANGKDGSNGTAFLGKSCTAPPACGTL